MGDSGNGYGPAISTHASHTDFTFHITNSVSSRARNFSSRKFGDGPRANLFARSRGHGTRLVCSNEAVRARLFGRRIRSHHDGVELCVCHRVANRDLVFPFVQPARRLGLFVATRGDVESD